MANLKPMHEKQIDRIQCRVTIQEKKMLQSKADAVGKALGRYIVDLGLADATRALPIQLGSAELADRMGISWGILSAIHQEIMDKKFTTGLAKAQIEDERLHLDANYRAAELLAVHDPDLLVWYAMTSKLDESVYPPTIAHWTVIKPLPVNKSIVKNSDVLMDYMLAVINGEQPKLTDAILAKDPLLANLTPSEPDVI